MRYLEFFKRQLVIAHVSGIPVRADYRWFFVLALMSWITASGIQSTNEDFTASFILGFLTTLVFFASIFLHELAHAVVARMENVQTLEIVLHPFGGLTRFRHAPDTPRAEFLIAVAGPAASFLLAVLFIALMAAFNSFGADVIARLFFTLGLLNFLLAVFNMFPGYPLDGGRVLRAYLWRRGADLNYATVLTGRCGQVIAAVFIAFGVLVALLQTDFFTGFWTILVGLFLYDAAAGIIKEVKNSEHRIVEEAMQLPVSVAPETDVLHFVERILSLHRRTIFPVAENRQLYGILSLEDLKTLPREDWSKTKIRHVMRPITPDYFVETDTPLAEAEFNRVFRRKEIPEEIEMREIEAGVPWSLPRLLFSTGLAASVSEARRLVDQGGVRIAGVPQTNNAVFSIKVGEESLLQVGKRRFLRVRGA